ncbi:hypothetical protein Salat_0020800 [Sesamum alatum]|uniref:Uncharacterized protein n=1 Tax=Sesamum alatum TaxID=300844 RepID=A0AAE1YV31_9LAMI|nr:hypothetical protein Salat_0020800 [Sesamum alatum]
MVAEPTILPQPVPAASLPPRPGPSSAIFVPTPSLPPRPPLPPFVPPRTTPPHSVPPTPPALTTEAAPPHERWKEICHFVNLNKVIGDKGKEKKGSKKKGCFV